MNAATRHCIGKASHDCRCQCRIVVQPRSIALGTRRMALISVWANIYEGSSQSKVLMCPDTSQPFLNNDSPCNTCIPCKTGAALYTIVAATAEEELVPSLQPHMTVHMASTSCLLLLAGAARC